MLNGHHKLPGVLPGHTLNSGSFLDVVIPIALGAITLASMLSLACKIQ